MESTVLYLYCNLMKTKFRATNLLFRKAGFPCKASLILQHHSQAHEGFFSYFSWFGYRMPPERKQSLQPPQVRWGFSGTGSNNCAIAQWVRSALWSDTTIFSVSFLVDMWAEPASFAFTCSLDPIKKLGSFLIEKVCSVIKISFPLVRFFTRSPNFQILLVVVPIRIGTKLASSV